MPVPSHLISPRGITVAVGSATEELTLRGRGYTDVPAKPAPKHPAPRPDAPAKAPAAEPTSPSKSTK